MRKLSQQAREKKSVNRYKLYKEARSSLTARLYRAKMPLEDVEKIVRNEPIGNYYDVGNELGR